MKYYILIAILFLFYATLCNCENDSIGYSVRACNSTYINQTEYIHGCGFASMCSGEKQCFSVMCNMFNQNPYSVGLTLFNLPPNKFIWINDKFPPVGLFLNGLYSVYVNDSIYLGFIPNSQFSCGNMYECYYYINMLFSNAYNSSRVLVETGSYPMTCSMDT
ncbi:MAG: hypothetical protein Satyrvirus2_6 [Satyrvirus sp.]|uniref:Uncharacterized protein n=1 Tax=Satyrvirus sp. TaxID=2487771 RepID=A0A3G5ACP0_9VIRU|nr:MAG: hypothetical protein Satyrvirus2_6 [Satyrvirus sp.]